jgi:hypothetical protein
MGIFTLMIGRSLTIPFAINLERTEKQQQREPELAVIDFALLSQAMRELRSDIEAATSHVSLLTSH